MPYRLEAQEILGDGVRRLIMESIDQIVIELTDPEGERDKGFHNARKGCKRVRGVYRLIRDEIGEQLYKRENVRFRDASRQFSAARDSWVMIQTLDEIMNKHQSQYPPNTFDGVRRMLSNNYEMTFASDLKNQQLISRHC